MHKSLSAIHGIDRLIYSIDSEEPLTNNIGGTTISDFRLYHKVIGTKVAWLT